MKVFLLTIFAFLVIVSGPTIAAACLCPEGVVPYCEQVSRADTVFVGTVKSIRSTDGLRESLIQFEVEQVYKGSTEATVDVAYWFGTSCSWLKFEIGERWLVYGYRKNSNETLSIPFCTGSHKFNDSGEDAKFLNDFKQGKTSESIRGRIFSNGDGSIAGAPVTITGGSFLQSTKSDADGGWEVSVPTPGKYRVKLSVPFSAILTDAYDSNFRLLDMKPGDSLSALEYEATVGKGLCGYSKLVFERVDLKATASISGRLLDSDGNPTKGFLRLQKWGLDETSTLKGGDFGFTDENGNYTFDGLREGRYVIVLNPNDFPEKNEPYVRTYLPGVPKFASAFVIELEQGKSINAPDFKLPKKLKKRTIDIEAVWPDGKPVTNWGPKAKTDTMPSVSLYRSDGKYIELADLVRTGPGRYSFTLYDGFSYVIRVEAFGSDDRSWNSYSQIPNRGVPKPIKAVLGQKYRDMDDFLRSLDPNKKEL